MCCFKLTLTIKSHALEHQKIIPLNFKILINSRQTLSSRFMQHVICWHKSNQIKSNLLGKYQPHYMYIHIDLSNNIYWLTFKGGIYVYIHLFSLKDSRKLVDIARCYLAMRPSANSTCNFVIKLGVEWCCWVRHGHCTTLRSIYLQYTLVVYISTCTLYTWLIRWFCKIHRISIWIFAYWDVVNIMMHNEIIIYGLFLHHRHTP